MQRFGWRVAASGGRWREIISGLRVELTILGRPRSSRDARPYPMHRDIFGSEVSAVRSRVRVVGFGYGCGLTDDRAGHPYQDAADASPTRPYPAQAVPAK